MKTAEELLNSIAKEHGYEDFDWFVRRGPTISIVDSVNKVIIDFAKKHVTEALKSVSEADILYDDYKYVPEYDDEIRITVVDRDLIIQAYPLENIK